MIIVSVGAGLGNQMFEYAFMTKLQIKYPSQMIKADTKYAFPYAHNGIEIFDIFNIKIPVASEKEVFRLTWKHLLNGEGVGARNPITKVIKKIGMHPSSMFIQKDYTEYYEFVEHLDQHRSYYLYGPFANYRYFRGAEENVKTTYIFPEIRDDRNRKYADKIKNGNSVSIHVRGGDYIKENVPLVPKEFYYKAFDIIEKTTGKADFYVFTDDQEYARSILSDSKDFIFVQGNNKHESYRDMQLMSMCKHNIIANSTFSFWGAYLNSNKDKMVIAPSIPFKNKKNAFVCDDWIVF